MKRMTYECKKCGKPCNGGALSFIVIESKNSFSVVLGNDMDQLPEHACGEEHMIQVFADAVRKLKGEEGPKAGKLVSLQADKQGAEAVNE